MLPGFLMPTFLDGLDDKFRALLAPALELPRARPKYRYAPLSSADKKMIKRLYLKEGLSTYAIAEKMGRHRTGIGTVLRKMGVMRTLSDAAINRSPKRTPTFQASRIGRRRPQTK